MVIFKKIGLISELRSILSIIIAAIFLSSNAAVAEVNSQSDNGFSVFHITDVAAEPDEIWSKIILPNSWWSGEHSFSGDAENFYLEPKINGCFCELLIDRDSEVQKETGVVEHMRIIHIRDYEVLRMTGALGPLQSEAVNGTFTIAIKSNGDGTSKISFLYVVGGYMRLEIPKIAPAIDRVVGEQFGNLVELIGPVLNSEEVDSADADFLDDEKSELSGDENIIDNAKGDEEDIKSEEELLESSTKEVRRER